MGWFEWGTDLSYGEYTTVGEFGSGTFPLRFNGQVSGLSPSTTYHYRLVAENADGQGIGDDRTFVTARPNAPIVTTDRSINQDPYTTRLFGTINPVGLATTGWFEWGLDQSYGERTLNRSYGSGSSPIEASWVVTGITPGETHHFRLVAESSGGPAVGEDRTFVAMTPFPVAPSELQATARAGTIIDLSWVDNSTAEHNCLIDRECDICYFTMTFGTLANVTSLSQGPEDLLFPGVTYTYRVKAHASWGQSGFSNDVSATAFDIGSDIDTVAPGAVGDLAVGAVTESAATLWWTASGDDGALAPRRRMTSGIIRYRLRLSTGRMLTP